MYGGLSKTVKTKQQKPFNQNTQSKKNRLTKRCVEV